MGETKYLDRPIPTVSLANFDSRIDKITRELVDAAENVGFFCITDHGISAAEVDAMFAESARFFALDDSVKGRVPFSSQHNAGWEKQVSLRNFSTRVG
jgi:isopenicillin N synthase-like dioxygenase